MQIQQESFLAPIFSSVGGYTLLDPLQGDLAPLATVPMDCHCDELNVTCKERTPDAGVSLNEKELSPASAS